MNKKNYNNYFEEEEERDFRRYQLDEDSEFESRLEAKNIIKAFIQTENDAEEIKSKALNKKPSYWKEQKDNKTEQLYNRKLDDDIELALDIMNKRRDVPKQPEKDNVLLNMELRHAKIKQMKEDRIKQKQEAELSRLQAQAQKFRPPSANAQNRTSNRGNASLQSSSQKSQPNNDWENQSQQSRPSTKQSQLNYQNSRQTFQTQSGVSLNNYLHNEMSLTDLGQASQQGGNPKNEIQVLKNKRQNLEVQSKKMEEDMKKMKENLRKELFQNNDSSMISNRNGGSNINETIDYLQKEADESRMKYNQFRLQKLVKAYNFVLKRYKRLFYNQFFESLKQKNREYVRHEQQCVNIMRLKKLFIVFSNWKKYVYSQKDEKDVKFYLQEKIHENTFLNRAGEYYKRRLIRICLRHWKKYWKICKQEQKLNEEKNNLKYKIKGFISNLKQNIQQSETEVLNQKEQHKQRVIEQFLRLNASQNQQNIEEDQQEEMDEEQFYEDSQKELQKQINQPVCEQKIQPKKIEKSNQNVKLQNSRQGTERNTLRSSMASQNSASSDYKPIRDNIQNLNKSPNQTKNSRIQSSSKDIKGTPQKKQSIQNNNRSPVQQSPLTSNGKRQQNNKQDDNKLYSKQQQPQQYNRQYDNQKQQYQSPQNEKYQQYYDHDNEEDYDDEARQQEQYSYYDQNDYDQDDNQQFYDEEYHDDDDENQLQSQNYDGHESMMTDIARSRVPQPSQSEQQQITFRQNQQSKSPNQRQNSKGHDESQMSGQTNKEKEREERLKQIQQRNEDRKKKAEEFKKKHEELRKQKEEEKKRKELEEIEKEREKRKEEFENYQKKKREEKEKKEKAEKEKKQLAEKLVLAKNHHQKSIQKYYGFKPWSKYMEFQEHLIVVANQFSYMRILKNGLQYLYQATNLSKQLFKQEMEFKEDKAKKHYQKTVLRKGFELIQGFSKQSKEEAEVYRQQRIDYLKRTVFYKWNDVLTTLRNENVAFEEQYKQIIIQFRKVVLQERSFRSWKQCINEEKIERIKAQQKNELRSKANQWLSEFKSSKNSNTENQDQQQDNEDKLSEQLRNSNFEDINQSQVKNEALKKYYNQRNKILQQKEGQDNQIEQDKYLKQRDNYDEEEEYEQQENESYVPYKTNNNEEEDEQYNEEDKKEQYYQSNEVYKQENDQYSDLEDGYQSILNNHQNVRVVNENKNYDLPLVQVLQNTNELQEKLARNNSKTKNTLANK
ncbi:hypothetical protein ABPG74_021139 [Tetrahymena malaccensis]